MKKCQPHILSQSQHLSITHCAKCKRIALSYKNLLFGYAYEDFACFVHNFAKIDFDKHAVPFPDQSHRIVIKTPHKDIQFTLDIQEYHELNNALQESNLLLSAYQLMS